jgi:RNA polymerase sigma-70 factor (ECF subfamily)
MNVSTSEPELRALMISGLDGDAAAHRTLLENLSSRLRGYFTGQLNRIGRADQWRLRISCKRR